jgi:TIR domain
VVTKIFGTVPAQKLLLEPSIGLSLWSCDLSGEAVKTRVFLSYSRKDGEFTQRLAKALEARGYIADYDQSDSDPANITSGISAEDEWWQRLQDMIVATDVVVFIVTPDSAASNVCDEEIAYSRGIGKRIIPILRRAIDFAKAPPRLSALNVKIEFLDDSEEVFAAALDQLCAALDLDVAWHRENRRLTELALKWNAAGRPDDSLMRRADVKASERLLERRPKSAELPLSLLNDYLDASRARIEEDSFQLKKLLDPSIADSALQALNEGRVGDALRLAMSVPPRQNVDNNEEGGPEGR